ncbi:hypothetical protein PPL_09356 [Heterostelium album PN500]|uniref:Uncharacterized protein n=1 Tax=Heterostelium pallidum (strain ATCC 26659 / Pp 5 / PN500) TaxID=670386 RepID=D3BLC3_HETP5|nr:hypothetical protein PPL_09356 [Heterostelium album PN500]EFA77857.1 hypothetical protein PPL_09356 [Heterostelium album PN500]|eukprot:XP_020429985.1 hypothetical protein PPL_09356 [Heterostelium album PN500]
MIHVVLVINRIKDIQTNIQTTCDSLKLKVVEYKQLQQTEQEIESKFKELHEFLVVEEHRLKIPIIDSKQQLEQQIDKQVMTYTTDNYQITTIIRSISQCSDHNEFISSNNNILFYFDDLNNNDDHSLLDKILEHNKTIKLYNFDDQQSTSQQYHLTFKNETNQSNQESNSIIICPITKTFVINEMIGVDEYSFMSACYDSQDHIYLFDGHGKNRVYIYRYNINNSTFERYTTIDITTYSHHITFLLKGYFYSFTPETKKIVKFDINSKTTADY